MDKTELILVRWTETQLEMIFFFMSAGSVNRKMFALFNCDNMSMVYLQLAALLSNGQKIQVA